MDHFQASTVVFSPARKGHSGALSSEHRAVFWLTFRLAFIITSRTLLLNIALLIVVADFPLIPNDACHNCFRLYDPRTRTAYPECLEIHTLEIPKRQMGDTSPLSQWLHFFAAHTEEDFMSLARINPVMERAWGVIKELSADEEARLQAEAQEKFRRDMDAMYKTGHFDGRAEGFADGEARRSRDIATNLLQLGLPLEQIATCTSLSVDQVRELSRQ